MATKPAAAASEEPPVKPVNRKKRILFFGVVGLVLAMAAGGGAAYVLKTRNPPSEEPEKKAEVPPVFMDLELFTANMVQEHVHDAYLVQMAVTLKVENQESITKIKAVLPEVRHSILLLLSSKPAQAVNTPAGKVRLAEEIKSRVNKLTGEATVRAVLFTSFMLQ